MDPLITDLFPLAISRWQMGPLGAGVSVGNRWVQVVSTCGHWKQCWQVVCKKPLAPWSQGLGFTCYQMGSLVVT